MATSVTSFDPGAGEWKDDLQDGLGTCQWVGGVEYRGSWKAGARHGQGVLQRLDGYTYDGEWAQDLCHGTGSCRSDDGSRQVLPYHSTHGHKCFQPSLLQSGCNQAVHMEVWQAQRMSAIMESCVISLFPLVTGTYLCRQRPSWHLYAISLHAVSDHRISDTSSIWPQFF